MPNYVPGIGPYQPKLMIIGESPGRIENESGIPFSGPTGDLLNACLFKAGINRSECYITNVVKYQPPFNDFTKLHLINVSLEESIKYLWKEEIRKLNPNCILAIGNHALNAVCELDGILNYRGSILLAKDQKTKVVPTIHPAALFGKGNEGDENFYKSGLEWTYLKLIEHDIVRAGEESLTRSYNIPQRNLTISHNSLDVHRFFREYEGKKLVFTDIESINCVPACQGFAFNKHHAMSVPLLRQIGNVQLTDMGYNELLEIWRLIAQKMLELYLGGHNLKYDEYKMSLVGVPFGRVYTDTLIKTRIIFPELPKKNLGTITSIWTREPYYKDDGKEFILGKHKIDNLLLYNANDCAVNYEVDEAQEEDLLSLAETYKIPLKEYYYDYQMLKHKAYLKMENKGWKVDHARKAELLFKYNQLAVDEHNKLVASIGQEVNVRSAPQMFELLYKIMKFKVPKRSPTSEEAIVRHIANHCKGGKTKFKPILENILEEKRIRSQLSKAINFTPDFDGRCKSTFNIIATETTRSSTGVLKAPLRPKKMKSVGLGFHTIPHHGRLAKDIRSMFIADDGYVIIKVDASQAEPRVVAVLSEDWELLKAFDEKVDIHRRTAGMLFGYSDKLYLSKDYHNDVIDNLLKDGPERFTGKTVRNAGNYDVKKGTLMETFNTNAQKFEINMNISEWKAGQMLEQFHNESPKIKAIFHAQIKEAIDSSRVLIDPFGGIRIFNGKFDDDIYKEGYANIPQRTVAHLVQGAMLKIYDELNGDLPLPPHLISEDHDALTLLAPANNWELYAKMMKKHMEVPIDFSIYCSLKRNYKLLIPAEVEMSETNYGDLKKIKI